MSAVSHIRSVLDHAQFPSPHIKGVLSRLLDALDEDLERTGYKPSRATEDSVRAVLDALMEEDRVGRVSEQWTAEEERAEEERDKERLS
jgi:hypothetical protein